jgi:hypothetical protein
MEIGAYRNKKEEYLNAKIYYLEINRKQKNIINYYRGITEFK